MARTTREDVSAADIQEYLDDCSDFAFELHCLEKITGAGFVCEHGGTYLDPVTDKPRQFDIRARKVEAPYSVRLAVECKNVRPHFPLVVMCVPRVDSECYHCLFTGYESAVVNIREVFRKGADSSYVAGEPVGKSCVQVGRGQDKSITGRDSEVYDKWSQAIASARDLLQESISDCITLKRETYSLALPVVVVPDGTLWVAEFDDKGKQVSGPTKTDRCSYFIGRKFELKYEMAFDFNPKISHVEFATLSGATNLMNEILDNPGKKWFPAVRPPT